MMLPLPLMIIIAVLAIQLILLIILWKKLSKKKRKIVLIIMFLFLSVGVWQGLLEYNRTNKDLSKVKADVKISATDMIKEYETNDSIANLKYLGKIIELNGTVKNVEKENTGDYTIVLGDTGKLSSVRCSMDSLYKDDAAMMTAGSSVIMRGACNGYKKNELLGENLGSDVELNRCVLVKKN